MSKRYSVLYVTNIEVPYRNKFFNQLAEKCDLTVLYERSLSTNRDSVWAGGVPKGYTAICYKGVDIGNENAFSISALMHMLRKYDVVILGCINSPMQILASFVMRLFRRRFIVNFDGEVFSEKTGFKYHLKKFIINGAAAYLSAGEKDAESLKEVVGDKTICTYYFSSLTKDEVISNSKEGSKAEREDFVLVIGQYYEYKGLDVVARAARLDPSIRYKIIGMGKRTEMFINEQEIDTIDNVTVIPFLQSQELNEEYMKAKAVVLPSRKECWGLVINEAASFGTPIASTKGSGAAVEFLSEDYPQYLAEPGDENSLYRAIREILQSNNEAYQEFLRKKSMQYSIEVMVDKHLGMFDKYVKKES